MPVLAIFGLALAGCGGQAGEAADEAEGDEAAEQAGGAATDEAERADAREGEGGEDEAEVRTLSVPAGTSFQVTLQQTLSTEANSKGDAFTVLTAQPLRADGRVAVPEGTEIRGTVTAVQHSEATGKPAVLKVAFDEVRMEGETYPIGASVTQANPEVRSRTSTAEGAAKVGAGAAAGAILGRIIGGDSEGTLIGAAVGAAAGTAIVLGTSDADAVLEEGSQMTLQLDQPLEVRVRTMTAGN